MNIHTELRKTYLGAAPHTLMMGLVWLISGVLPLFFSKSLTILFFFFAAGAAFSAGEALNKALKTPKVISEENNLPKLFLFLGMTIPLAFPVVYMALQYNSNWFFPAFAIIVGGHYLPFIWAYKMPTFGILGGLLIAVGVGCAFWLPEHFSTAAYITGAVLLTFAALHFWLVRRELDTAKAK